MSYTQDFSSGLFGKYQKVVDHLPPGGSILEIGCHTGSFGRLLVDRGHHVVGLEQDAEAAAMAMSAGLPVIVGNVEDAGQIASIQEKFDVVLLMDVLEHLLRPRDVLRALEHVLNPEGCILITGPNVAHWGVRKELLLGRWNYGDGGVLDRTHLRFYTGAAWRALVEEAGYRVVVFEPAEGCVPLVHHLGRLPFLSRLPARLSRVGTRLAPGLFAVSFLSVAVPSNPISVSTGDSGGV